MKGDFTRNTFDPLKHFSRVLMQQGRVQLDADFNEQASILLHYLRTMMTDLIGSYGGPAGSLGFEIGQIESNDCTIGAGRYYVDGILCENDAVINFSEQEYIKSLTPDLKKKFSPLSEGAYYVYLDVWERHVTYVQEDIIREKALGGPDTCTRAAVVWQVKLYDTSEGSSTEKEKQRIKRDIAALKKKKTEHADMIKEIQSKIAELEKQLGSMGTTAAPSCAAAKEWLNQLPKLSNAQLKARLQPSEGEPDVCKERPETRYRGAENQLYRIEIHKGGPAGKATFKWSRDNGSIVFPIIRQKSEAVALQSLGRDELTGLKVGDWVEIMDDDVELRGEAGIMAEVERVDHGTMTVYLKHLDDNDNWPDYEEKSTNHPLLRRWDQRVKEGIKITGGAVVIAESSESWIEIEDGIEVQFQPRPAGKEGSYRTGDYWLIPARVATGKIEWPTSTDQKNNEVPKALPPHGIEHHYAPLAVISGGKPTDCRCTIEPAAICPDSLHKNPAFPDKHKPRPKLPIHDK